MFMKKKFFIYLIIVLISSFSMHLNKKNLYLNDNFELSGYGDLYYVIDGSTSSLTFELKDNVEHNNQLSNYFFNLKDNIPSNLAGSCGYVSQSLILGYFDTYFNNNVVADNLISKVNLLSIDEINEKSPGHIDDNFVPSIQLIANNQYFNYIKDNPNKSLHFNLMSKAMNLGIIPSSFSGSNEIYATSHEEIELVFDEYLENNDVDTLFYNYCELNASYDNLYVSGSFTEEAYSNSETLKESILNLIFQGIPVIVGVAYFKDSSYVGSPDGHAVVAYDYIVTSSGIEILVHNGCKNESCAQLGGYYCITGYNVLMPWNYSNHVCSSNYLVNNQGYCPCTFDNHEHKYVDYQSSGIAKHTKICYCGYSTFEAHKMSTNANGNYCTLCGFISSGNNFINKNNPEEVC